MYFKNISIADACTSIYLIIYINVSLKYKILIV